MTRTVRVGIIDSGVNPAHPHVANIMGGVAMDPSGDSPEFLDFLGHGTAIAALIHEKAPQALLFAVKVFHQKLATDLETVLRAINWCISHEMDIINLSLGTLNPEHRAAFESAVQQACCEGKVIVSAFESDGHPALPGCLPGVIGVSIGAHCPQGRHYFREVCGKIVFLASPFPRPIPGVPPERNLHGISFAVAHITGVVAREWAAESKTVNWEQRLAQLAECTEPRTITIPNNEFRQAP